MKCWTQAKFALPDGGVPYVYWAARRRKGPPLPLDKTTLRLLQAQHGRCPVCGGQLLPAESTPGSPREWERWFRTTRKAISTTIAPVGGPTEVSRRRLTHVTCQRRHHVRDTASQEF
jgi:RNA-directed DNA polymerase